MITPLFAALLLAQSPVIQRHAAEAPGIVDSIGKPLLAVLLTHGHPDHYNGVTNLIAGHAVPVLATAGVDSVIRADDAAKEQQWKPRFQDEWPRQRAFPTRIVRNGETVVFDGARFTVGALGPGESKHDSYWVLQGQPVAAFIGDVVLNRVHAYTSDGHTTEWLATDRLEFLIAFGADPVAAELARKRRRS